MKRIYNRLKHILFCEGCKYLEERTRQYPDTLLLNERHLSNCKVVENRDKLLEFLPKNSVCAEIGIETAKTSQRILEVIQPAALHLIEIEEKWVENARQKFSEAISRKQVFLHHGASYNELSRFDDNYFDWVYIDGDHKYEGVKKDLEVARRKVKDDGLIWLHDYIFYDHISHEKYGVIEAVNEMCHENDYEIIYFALHQQMFNSVVLKKIVT